MFKIAFDRLKNAFNIQKVYLKKKSTHFVKKVKMLLRVQKA